nr:carbonic anhydrase family protein [uncultured Flavobacterium sp.]
MKKLILSLSVLLAFASCNKVTINDDEIIETHVLTKEEQEKLTPDKVIADLIAGNKDFTEDNLTVRNSTKLVREAALGQYPEAVVLSCLDSRVPVEDVFHKAIGEIFVARVAGNIINPDILGSLEYACKVSGSKVIVVLGHEYCGAIKSSIDGVKLGNITTMLEKIEPAIVEAKQNFKGEANAKNPEFVDEVCKFNVFNSIEEIRKHSPILKEMEDNKEIKIVGAVYDMKTGKVNFLD